MKSIQKIALCLLSLLLFIQPAVKAQQVDSVHAEKAKRIIERLSLKKMLPDRFHDERHSDTRDLPEHEYAFAYYTRRVKSGNQNDSVLMYVSFNDSINALNFDELINITVDTAIEYNYSYANGMVTRGCRAKYSSPTEESVYEDMKVEALLPKLYYSIDELYDLLFKK